jgi:ribonuclease T2
MWTRFFPSTLLICVTLFCVAKPAASQEFSYYLLVLSYAPDFCAQPQGKKDPRECGNGRQVGFVVHGLWPQDDNSRGPENCGAARPVSQAIVQAMLQYIPSESLIQHEWKTHGVCTGMSAADYFAAIRKAREAVNLPDRIKQPQQNLEMRPGEIESLLAAANPKFPKTAFRTSCYPDRELKEVRVCLNKDLSPRSCGPSAGECRATRLTLNPVR